MLIVFRASVDAESLYKYADREYDYFDYFSVVQNLIAT
jgi:hypothetical protein